MKHKRIAIVTVNLNNKEGLKKTIESVVNQTFFKKINYIIIDGGSTDGSQDIIKEYENFLAYHCSEKDSGVYNAMNKGISVANGTYLLFLNSGDNLCNNMVIENIYNHLKKDIVYGDLLVNNNYIKKYPDKITQEYLLEDTLPHPATFIKKSVIVGNEYREDYKIISDWVFFYESIINRKLTYKHLNYVISNFSLGGLSSNVLNTLLEKRKYLESIYYNYEIGVVIPCYNQGKYIKETIESVKASTYRNFQCVIVNDGSTDNSEEIIQNAINGDDRFMYVYQNNGGLSNARNVGICKLNSKYILCLDSDDKISNTYIEGGVKYLNEHDDVSIYYGKAKMFLDDGKEIDWNLPEFNYKSLLITNQIFCSHIYRRRDYNKIGGYDEKMRKGYEDWDFLIRLLYKNRNVYRTDECVFYYRRHGESMDNQTNKEQKEEIKKYIMSKNIAIYSSEFNIRKTK